MSASASATRPSTSAAIVCSTPGTKNATQTLSAGFSTAAGIQGARSLARCDFTPTANVEPEDFDIEITEATDIGGRPVATPVVQVIPY
jgi:hypothetical protein